MDITPRRAQRLMARAVIPVSYGALRTWVDSVGVEAVVCNYLEQACLAPEYLGHRLSILLGFLEAWPNYRDSSDRILFIDRLAEFILACQFQLEAPTDAGKFAHPMSSWDEALSAALQQPGFFGHHLICLAWAGRSRDVLTDRQFSHAMAWVVQASLTQYPDEEDNVFIDIMEDAAVANAALEITLQNLLTRGEPNIHLLTLADSIAWLWFKVNTDRRRYLLAVVERFIK
jgi:hypothetical protein